MKELLDLKIRPNGTLMLSTALRKTQLFQEYCRILNSRGRVYNSNSFEVMDDFQRNFLGSRNAYFSYDKEYNFYLVYGEFDPNTKQISYSTFPYPREMDIDDLHLLVEENWNRSFLVTTKAKRERKYDDKSIHPEWICLSQLTLDALRLKSDIGDVSSKSYDKLSPKSTPTKQINKQSTKSLKKEFQEREAEKMTTNSVKKDKSVSNTVSMAKRAATHGAKVAAVDEIGETLLVFARELTGYDFSENGDPVKNEVAKMVVATLLHAATENFDVPYGEGVAAACELQIEASSRDVIQPRLKQFRPLFENLAKLGGSALTPKK